MITFELGYTERDEKINALRPAHLPKLSSKVNIKKDGEKQCDDPLLVCEKHFDATSFPQVLGTAEITEVFKVVLLIKDGFLIHYFTDTEGKYYVVEDDWSIVQQDGFKSAEEMFKALDTLYDLSSPKAFYVCRWKWNLPEAV